MCGRYVRGSDKQKIAEYFQANPRPAELPIPDEDFAGCLKKISERFLISGIINISSLTLGSRLPRWLDLAGIVFGDVHLEVRNF